MSNTKRCTKCGELKPFDQFGRDRRKRDGLKSSCKRCESLATLDWQRRNPEKANAKNRKWQRENPEKKRDYCRKWREKNPEKQNEYQRRCYRKHEAKRRESGIRYRRENRERQSIKARIWQITHPEAVRANNSRRRARRRNAEGSFTSEHIKSLYRSQNGLCVYYNLNPECTRSLADGYNVDHVIPLARGGSNWPDNLQLLCPFCNRSKNNKTHEEFLAHLGRKR